MYNTNFRDKLIKALSYNYIEADFYKVAEDYDMKDSLSLEGHREKEFLRLDSSLFGDLIDELQNNPNCSYVTYANKLLKEGYIPKKLSCMVKRLEPDSHSQMKVDDPELTFKEALASQILNLYGCPTAHNITIKDSEIEQDYAFTSVSVDMVSNDIITLENLRGELTNDLGKNLELISTNLQARRQRLGISQELVDTYSHQITNDYAYSFLIRKFILQDGDFYEYNGGILVDENKLQYVNFDFEHIFFDYYLWPNISKSLQVVQQQFPETYEKFSHTSKMMYDNLIDITKHRDLEYANDNHQENVNTLIMNLRTAVLACKHIEKSHTK